MRVQVSRDPKHGVGFFLARLLKGPAPLFRLRERRNTFNRSGRGTIVLHCFANMKIACCRGTQRGMLVSTSGCSPVLLNAHARRVAGHGLRREPFQSHSGQLHQQRRLASPYIDSRMHSVHAAARCALARSTHQRCTICGTRKPVICKPPARNRSSSSAKSALPGHTHTHIGPQGGHTPHMMIPKKASNKALERWRTGGLKI
jgi:hypothetical protein